MERVAGAARVIGRATCGQPVSCHYRPVAASGTDFEDSKTSSWSPGLRALDGGKPRRDRACRVRALSAEQGRAEGGRAEVCARGGCGDYDYT